MRINTMSKFGFLAVTAFLAGSASLMASTISFSGTLPNPNALFEVQFTLGTASDLTLQTSSWAAGNFDPVLWLFDSTGATQLAKNDDTSVSNKDSTISLTGFAAGTYLAVVSSFDQHWCVANTVCNGTVYGNTGWSYNGNFFGRGTGYALSIAATAANTPTTNSSGVITNAPQAFATPEPASAGLLIAGGAVLGWLRFRRSRKIA
jgi:Bacterial pre-peptidase C-terminal domain/PEP-CTERM motif